MRAAGSTGRPRQRRSCCAVLALVVFIAALAAGCASGGTSSPAPAPAPTPRDASPGRLLFTRLNALHTLDLATSKTTEIITPPTLGQIHAARWSPDGTRVVYSLYEVRDGRTPVAEILVATSSGGGATKLVRADQAATFFQAPVWGPNNAVYFMHVATSGQQRVRQIERMDLTSGKRDVVLPEVGQFDVSPDGKWLALVRSESGGAALVLVDLATMETRDLVPRGRHEVISAPRFDPTSKILAFSAAQPYGPASGRLPGDFLLSVLGVGVARAHGAPQDLWTIPVAGGAATQLTRIGIDEPVAAWAPDGSKFALLSSESLSMLELTGGQPAPLLTPGGYGTVDWTR